MAKIVQGSRFEYFVCDLATQLKADRASSGCIKEGKETSNETIRSTHDFGNVRECLCTERCAKDNIANIVVVASSHDFWRTIIGWKWLSGGGA